MRQPRGCLDDDTIIIARGAELIESLRNLVDGIVVWHIEKFHDCFGAHIVATFLREKHQNTGDCATRGVLALLLQLGDVCAADYFRAQTLKLPLGSLAACS